MKIIISMFALAISLMGVLFISSWHLGAFSILLLPPGSWPMPYIASMCLFLSGFALFCILLRMREMIVKVLGFSILFLGFQRAAGFFFPSDFSLNLLLNRVHFRPSYSSEMGIGGAIGFIFVGVIFLFYSRNAKFFHRMVSLPFSVAVIFLGSMGIFLGILPRGVLSSNHLIHFYTAVGLFLIGLALVVNRFAGTNLHLYGPDR